MEMEIPNYSSYNIDELVDVYLRIDRENNVERVHAIEGELIKRLNIAPGVKISGPYIKDLYQDLKRKETASNQIDIKYIQMIRAGWITGLICATISFLMLAASIGSQGLEQFNLFQVVCGLIDVAILYGLSYGIYKKSRVCAVFMLAVYMQVKINEYTIQAQSGTVKISIVPVLVSLLFICAIWGTIQYHRQNTFSQLTGTLPKPSALQPQETEEMIKTEG